MKLGSYVGGGAAAVLAVVGLVTWVAGLVTPKPVPDVIQLQKVPPDSIAFSSGATRWMVSVENPTDRPLAITQANYKVATLDPYAASYANAIEITGTVYRLPLNCSAGEGSRPIVPAFPVPPKSVATFVIEGGKRDLDCTFLLSFETNQGRTKTMLAEAF